MTYQTIVIWGSQGHGRMARTLMMGVGEWLYGLYSRARRRKAEESKKGWVHHIKVEKREICYRARKMYRVLRVGYTRLSIPVLGRN